MSSEHEWPVEVWAELAGERRKDPRNRVIELVRYGKLSRERAEAWARERGLGPFESRPASGKHDPMAEMDWTLAMTTAWIIWRTPQAVQRHMEAYAEQCVDWVPCDYRRPARRGSAPSYRVRGFELQRPEVLRPEGVLSRAPFSKASGASEVTEPERAERELREALRRGDPLIARGGPRADPIEKHRWSVLSPFASPYRGATHDAVYDDQGEVQFSRVRVERGAVLKVWLGQEGW